MMTESSYISSSSRSNRSRSRSMRSSKLKQIESQVIFKIIHLKNQKIDLLQQLNEIVDYRYAAEDRLVSVLEDKKKKEQRIVQKYEYEPVIHRYYELNDLMKELERKTYEKYHGGESRQKSIEEGMLDMIFEQKEENEKIMKEINENQAQNSVDEKIKRIRQRISVVHKQVMKKQIEGSFISEQRLGVKELEAYIMEEQKNKRLLYDQLLEFRAQMEDLHDENQKLKALLVEEQN